MIAWDPMLEMYPTLFLPKLRSPACGSLTHCRPIAVPQERHSQRLGARDALRVMASLAGLPESRSRAMVSGVEQACVARTGSRGRTGKRAESTV